MVAEFNYFVALSENVFNYQKIIENYETINRHLRFYGKNQLFNFHY